MVHFLLVKFVLSGIFFIEFLVAADKSGNLIVSVVASAFESLIFAYELSDMCIALMNLHLEGVDVFPEFGDGSAVDVSFGSWVRE